MVATTPRVRHRRSVSAAMLVTLVAGFAGACGGSNSDEGSATDSSSLETAAPPAPSGTTTSLPVLSGTDPVGVIALGHSGLTAENSDPAKPGQPALENSWATGTNPDVNSIYLRLIGVHPETKGHVANTAVGGGLATQLTSQAKEALSIVPTPELVIIQTIDNDLRCPLDENAVKRFGDSVSSALDKIVKASPQSQILMVGQLGTGLPENGFPMLEKLIAAHPEVKQELTGDGSFPCGGFYGPSGEPLQENLDELTRTVEAYEAEQQRRCDAVPQCRTDEGAQRGLRPGVGEPLVRFEPPQRSWPSRRG